MLPLSNARVRWCVGGVRPVRHSLGRVRVGVFRVVRVVRGVRGVRGNRVVKGDRVNKFYRVNRVNRKGL